MATCHCEQIPETLFLDEAPLDWFDRLSEVATGDWKTLRRCTLCSHLFAVDAWDKGQDQVVVRVTYLAHWQEEADSVNRRKALLLRSRGGLDTGACAWAGCGSPRVRRVAYCLDHLWGSGARR